MCLIPSHPECKKATKDIVVYKVLVPDNDSISKKKKQVLCSPYKAHPWQLGKLEVVKKSNIKEYGCLVISEGLHAFTNIEAAMREVYSWEKKTDIYRAIIPKGSWYKVNDRSSHIASTKMIIKSRCRNIQK